MNLNKFTEKAQEAVLDAQRLTEEYNHSEIQPSHLLLALLRQEGGVIPQIVHHLGLNQHTDRAYLGEPLPVGREPLP